MEEFKSITQENKEGNSDVSITSKISQILGSQNPEKQIKELVELETNPLKLKENICQLILEASKMGNNGVFDAIFGLKLKINLPFIEEGNFKPIVIASKLGLHKIIQELMLSMNNFHDLIQYNVTLLHLAIINGYKQIAMFLIENGADVNPKAYQNLTPLHCASSQGHKQIVILLIENGSDVNAKADQNLTPLHCVSSQGHKQIALLLIENGSDVNAKADHNLTALHYASQNGHKQIAHLLIENGSDVNAKTDHNCTPLHCASSQGHKQIALLLIENGSDVNAKADHNLTALHYASSQGHQQIAILLIENGSDVNVNANDNWTPLHCASSKGHKQIVMVLIQNEANCTIKAYGQYSLLYTSAIYGHKQIVEYFLSLDREKIVSIPLNNILLQNPLFTNEILKIFLEYETRNFLIQFKCQLSQFRMDQLESEILQTIYILFSSTILLQNIQSSWLKVLVTKQIIGAMNIVKSNDVTEQINYQEALTKAISTNNYDMIEYLISNEKTKNQFIASQTGNKQLRHANIQDFELLVISDCLNEIEEQMIPNQVVCSWMIESQYLEDSF